LNASDELELASSEQQNQAAYDRMARAGHILAKTVTAEELGRPLAIVDGAGWLGGSIRGWKVLCLAAAGGRHSALYHAAGANVTVLDISDGMLELDRRVSQELKFNVRLIQGSMLEMPMLQDAEFDLVIQPVSTCYVPEVACVFAEVARVLKPNGLYVSQHKQPINLQASLKTQNGKYAIETEQGAIAIAAKPDEPSPLREPSTREFAHSLESILGGICKSGMVIEDIVEPNHAKNDSRPDSIGHRSRFLPPYIRIKARKKGGQAKQSSGLILP
jgi:ubiquinone/menaquinone biosynthesis C-methylase UbiE